MLGLRTLQREMIDAEDKLKRLYRLVEEGLTDVDEVFKDGLKTLKADRDRAKAALEPGQGAFSLSDPDRSGVDRTFRPYYAGELQHRIGPLPESVPVVAIKLMSLKSMTTKSALKEVRTCLPPQPARFYFRHRNRRNFARL